MRDQVILRLLAILLLAGTMAGPSIVATPSFAAPSQEDNEGKGKEDKDDKKEKDDQKDKKEKKDKKDKGGPEVSETEGYMVNVVCQFDEAAGTTNCAFTGIAPEGASEVGHVDLPEEAVCTEVLGGDHEYVDPDPNTRVTGYKSRGKEGTFTLVLQGEVVPGGTTTYWFKTGDGVFPAPGPGLVCEPGSLSGADDGTPAAPATATVSTGELVVMVYGCATIPTDSATFDWFGECDPAIEPHHFVLELLHEHAGPPTATESDGSGNARFGELEPGLYSLEMTDTGWCHATSDNVTDNGKVIVDAGGRTTVWIFTCESTE